MNMKDTVILLIFLLSIVGLIIGVYYTEVLNNENSQDTSLFEVYEDSHGVVTITYEEKENNDLSNYFT